MKAKILGLLAVALLAGPTAANAVTISYGIGVTDSGAPSVFAFSFFIPIAPIAGLATYSFTGSFTLVDGGTDGVSISPGIILPEYWRLSVFSPLTLVDDVGGTASLVGAGTYNFTASGSFDCSALLGGCDGLQLVLSFPLSGGGDSLSSNGAFTLDPASTVPEPGTLALLGLGLAGLGLSRRRKAD